MDARGGGGGLIYSRTLLNVRVVPNHMDVSFFLSFWEITCYSSSSNYQDDTVNE